MWQCSLMIPSMQTWGAAPPAPPALIPHLYMYLRGNLIMCGVHGAWKKKLRYKEGKDNGDASTWRTLETMLKAWVNSSVKYWEKMLVLACG